MCIAICASASEADLIALYNFAIAIREVACHMHGRNLPSECADK
jgi:hypothetical protein